MKYKKLTQNFYGGDTLKVAKALLGKYLVRKYHSKKLAGRIVETEAYVGPNDLASHASRGKTSRNSIMFDEAGYWYVYLVYGLNYCLNVVTEKKGYPAAVLIRALEPITGIEIMMKLRGINDINQLTNGPGKLCQAFRINKKLNGTKAFGNELYIEDRGYRVSGSEIKSANRVGVDYAGKYKDKKWRFYLKDCQFVSLR